MLVLDGEGGSVYFGPLEDWVVATLAALHEMKLYELINVIYMIFIEISRSR